MEERPKLGQISQHFHTFPKVSRFPSWCRAGRNELPCAKKTHIGASSQRSPIIQVQWEGGTYDLLQTKNSLKITPYRLFSTLKAEFSSSVQPFSVPGSNWHSEHITYWQHHSKIGHISQHFHTIPKFHSFLHDVELELRPANSHVRRRPHCSKFRAPSTIIHKSHEKEARTTFRRWSTQKNSYPQGMLQ